MSIGRLTDFTIKRISKILCNALKKARKTLKKGSLLKIGKKAEALAAVSKNPKPYLELINKPDPYQWPHPHDRKWFLLEVLKLMNVAGANSEINTIQYLYCIEATTQHILIHHNSNLVKGEDYFTFNWVLDLLSAAYGVPLLPDLPTEYAKEITEFILYKKIPPLELA